MDITWIFFVKIFYNFGTFSWRFSAVEASARGLGRKYAKFEHVVTVLIYKRLTPQGLAGKYFRDSLVPFQLRKRAGGKWTFCDFFGKRRVPVKTNPPLIWISPPLIRTSPDLIRTSPPLVSGKREVVKIKRETVKIKRAEGAKWWETGGRGAPLCAFCLHFAAISSFFVLSKFFTVSNNRYEVLFIISSGGWNVFVSRENTSNRLFYTFSV